MTGAARLLSRRGRAFCWGLRQPSIGRAVDGVELERSKRWRDRKGCQPLRRGWRQGSPEIVPILRAEQAEIAERAFDVPEEQPAAKSPCLNVGGQQELPERLDEWRALGQDVDGYGQKQPVGDERRYPRVPCPSACGSSRKAAPILGASGGKFSRNPR